MGAAVHLNPSDLTDEQVQRLARAVAVYVKDDSLEEPMTIDEVATWIKASKRTVSRMQNNGDLKAHYFPGLKGPRFFKSEINKKIKEY